MMQRESLSSDLRTVLAAAIPFSTRRGSKVVPNRSLTHTEFGSNFPMELPLIPKCYGSGEDFGRNYPIMNQLPFLVRVCSIVLVITQLTKRRSSLCSNRFVA